jgi:hypothetical protein
MATAPCQNVEQAHEQQRSFVMHALISTMSNRVGRKARVLIGSAAALAALAVLPVQQAHAQAYVNVTVGGAVAPGVYGQIAIGNNPMPPVINAQPIIVGQPIYAAPPVYMYVPVEHQRDWGRYCSYYRTCGYPVHFVQFDPRNRWWEHHNRHLRGEGYYRQPEPSRRDYGHDRGHHGRDHDERGGRGGDRH